ncbi:MAG: LacI family DNA-binding transcriptional regulator [Pseudomonadota bacterium]
MGISRSSARRIRPKINDVADLAGVSIKTVSRVLNNEPNVRPETRDKVKAAVRDLNYVPDVSARSLAGHRSYIFAMFYDTASESYLSRFQKGALDACREHHYHLIVERCSIADAGTPERIAKTAAQLRVDGVVLLPPVGDTASIVERFAGLSIPAALISPGGETHDMPSVRMDDKAAAMELTRLLIERGHRRIGFIKGHEDHGASALRFSGYLRALEEAGIQSDDALISSGDFSFASGLTAANQLLAQENSPSAIFASNDDMAAAAIRAAVDSGLSVPEDMSVVGFDDALIASATNPSLTTVRQPVEVMAEAAVKGLVASLLRSAGEEDDTHFTAPFDYELIHRSSVGDGPFSGGN